jgi:hypothetical protein
MKHLKHFNKFGINEAIDQSILDKLTSEVSLELEDKVDVELQNVGKVRNFDDRYIISIGLTLPDEVCDPENEDFYDYVENYIIKDGEPFVRELMNKFCRKYNYTLVDIEYQDNDEFNRGDSEYDFWVEIEL